LKLRLATMDDLPPLCVLGRIMHAESTFAPLDYDIEMVKETLTELMNKNQFVVVAEDTNGELVAVMLGKVVPTWFGNDLVANELALFIHPEHRGGLLAAKLIKMFVMWAKLAGAKQIRPGVISGNKTAVALYERLGFTNCGATFVMEGV
jgi:GNAT superfamily N-acetyltransferase